jgi:hypothetical protein
MNSLASASAFTGVRVAAKATRPAQRRAAVVVRAEEGGKIEKKARRAGRARGTPASAAPLHSGG